MRYSTSKKSLPCNTGNRIKRKKLISTEAKTGLMFIFPWIVGTALFFAFPIFRSVLLSFNKLINVTEFQLAFRGFEYYKEAFFSDYVFFPAFILSVKNMLINVPLINVFSFAIALLLNSKIKARGAFRAIFFLPVILGSGFIMQQLIGMNVQQETVEIARGILLPEQVTNYLGPAASNFIREFLNRITTILWSSGVQILIYLSGLQSISGSIYEAARVDSASKWEMLWLITLPLMTPMILLNLIYTVIDSYASASNEVIVYIVDMAFKKSKFELSSAMGWIYFTACLLFIGIVFMVMNRFVDRVKESN